MLNLQNNGDQLGWLRHSGQGYNRTNGYLSQFLYYFRFALGKFIILTLLPLFQHVMHIINITVWIDHLEPKIAVPLILLLLLKFIRAQRTHITAIIYMSKNTIKVKIIYMLNKDLQIYKSTLIKTNYERINNTNLFN